MKKRYKDSIEILVKRWWILTGIAMFASFSLSLFMGLGQSIWFDEGYSILVAKEPLRELIALTNVDAHPPLFYILLKAWAGIFGWSELALRSLSALLMAGAVGGAIVLTRLLFSVRIALFVTPFLIFAPFLLRYGYEVRMYALATIIVILATCVLVYVLQRPRHRGYWLIYGFLVAAGMYTLYMTVVVWIAHLVWLLLTVRPRSALIRHPAIMGYIFAFIIFLPQLPVFIHQMLHSALPGVGTELTLTKLVSVLGLMTIYTPEWQLGGWMSVALLVAAVLFGVIFAQALKSKHYRMGLLFIATLVSVPLIFYAVTSLPPRKPIFIERYMAHVAIFFYLLIAVVAAIGLRGPKKRLAVAFTAITIFLLVIGVVRLYQAGNLNLERMQLPKTQELRASVPCSDNTTIVADDPYTYIDSVYYFDNCTVVFYHEKPVDFQGGYAPLSKGDARVGSPSEVTSSQLVHLHWAGSEVNFVPDSSYRLISQQTFGKQVVTIYEK
jgi:mannosyltransferase